LNDAQRHKLERNTGVQVAIVVRGTPAFKANFLEGDILLKLNGRDISDVPTLSSDLMQMAGARVTFDVLRDDHPRTIAVTLNP
jgi:S1-C subfamily serine protease